MTVQEITTKDIQDYVTVKAKTGISLQTIKKHVALLDSVFRNAYMSRIIDENPVSRLEHIKAPSHKLECMDEHEIALLCDSVEGTQLEVPVKLAVYLGLRRGEVLGLKWEHIDFKNAVLYVNNTRTQAGRNTIEKQPKTERSIRQLHLPQELVDLLVEQKKKSSRIMVKNQAMTDYVAFMDNGRPFKPNYLSECFRNHLLSKGYKPIRFHDLRHSFASIANDAGISMNEISSAMGHSNISTTSEIYTHEFSKTKTKAVNAVSQCISQAKTTGNTYNNSTP
jgi:integrase